MCYQILGICGRYWIRYCDKYCTILQVTNLKTLVYKVNKFLKLKTLSSDKLSETIKATYFICDNPYKHGVAFGFYSILSWTPFIRSVCRFSMCHLLHGQLVIRGLSPFNVCHFFCGSENVEKIGRFIKKIEEVTNVENVLDFRSYKLIVSKHRPTL